MKTLLKNVPLFLFIFALALTGCASPATPPVPTATQPPAENPLAKVVLNMAERLNAGDLNGSLDYFADDSITYFAGLPPTGMEIYRGKEGLRPVWTDCISNHFKMEVEIVSVTGDVVAARSKTWHDFTRQLGVAPNEFIETYQVKDGKIALYSSTITGDALAKFKPALAAAMPPEPTAAPANDAPVSEITVNFADGTCNYAGPLLLKTGEINVNINSTDKFPKTYGLTFFSLNKGKDLLDLMAATPLATPPSWSKMLTIWEFASGDSKTVSFTAQTGPLYLVCWSKPPDLAIGNVGPFEVR
jgi:ketosteroid isomerase-like protein